MNIGLIGLPKSGKTTVFHALTGRVLDEQPYGARDKTQMASVEVSDPRVGRLSSLYEPKKTTYAQIGLIDFPAIEESDRESFSGEELNRIKSCDAIALVVRNFAEPSVDAEFGGADPAAEFESVYSELLLNDQIVAERRTERLAEDHKKGKKPLNPREERLLASLIEAVDKGTPVREVELDREAARLASGFQFLTAKPMFVIVNSDEQRYGTGDLEIRLPSIEFAGRFEAELSALDSEAATEFLDDAGIGDSARARLSTFAYGVLGYSSFFTVGDDEVRAWTIRRGSDVVTAAAAIHSDLARGFIRAEVFESQMLFELGSESELRKAGKIRLEGKTYEVKDGDVIHVRFSV